MNLDRESNFLTLLQCVAHSGSQCVAESRNVSLKAVMCHQQSSSIATSHLNDETTSDIPVILPPRTAQKRHLERRRSKVPPTLRVGLDGKNMKHITLFKSRGIRYVNIVNTRSKRREPAGTNTGCIGHPASTGS